MVLNKFRHISDKLIKSQVEFFARRNISANTISYVGFGIMICAAVGYAFPRYFIYNPWFSWVPVLLFFISAYFDVLDGGVARLMGTDSNYGGFLDSTLDRMADGVIILGLMLGGMFFPWNRIVNDLIGFIAMAVIFLISYTRSRAENEGVVMKGIGFMERAERVFIIIGAYLIEANLFFWLQVVPPEISYLIYDTVGWFFPIFFMIFIMVCGHTLIARIIHARRWLTGNISDDYLTKHDLLDVYPKKLRK